MWSPNGQMVEHFDTAVPSTSTATVDKPDGAAGALVINRGTGPKINIAF